ncbi:MAG: phosphotransferase family protein, partial [Stackebrandtia sp.]
VVRRPPLGHVLATAHDMGREYQVMAALAGTAVPVPPVHLLCRDTDIIGAPFYLMDFVPGAVYRRASQTADLGARRAETMSRHLIDVLAQLHAVDPDAVGLRDFGHGPGYLRRQVIRWQKQAAGSRNRELPDLDVLQSLLADSIPDTQRDTIVHGDYRLDNLLMADDDSVAAVLDWEMSTIGDPLADLGLLRVYWDGLGEVPGGPVADAVNPRAGFPASDVLIERYAARSDLDLSALDWYEAFAYYKLAVILEGIHYRYIHGRTVGGGFDQVGPVVPLLAASGRRRLARR